MCPYCKTECSTLNPGRRFEGCGELLIILDTVTEAMDFNETYYAGPEGKLLSELLERAGIPREGVTVTGLQECFNSGPVSRLSLPTPADSVIVLGAEGLRVLVGRGNLKTVRGQELKAKPGTGLEHVRVTASYDLGLIRRVPTYKNTVVGDLRKAAQNKNSEEELIDWEYWNHEEVPL